MPKPLFRYPLFPMPKCRAKLAGVETGLYFKESTQIGGVGITGFVGDLMDVQLGVG